MSSQSGRTLLAICLTAALVAPAWSEDSAALNRALTAWQQGCDAIRSYDIQVANTETWLLRPSDQKPLDKPIVQNHHAREVWEAGRRRVERELNKEGAEMSIIGVWDGQLGKGYLPRQKELVVSDEPRTPLGEATYESWFRSPGTSVPYTDVFRARPEARVESESDETCVLSTPPIIGKFEYAPFGFRVTLDKNKSWLPRRIDILLEVDGQTITRQSYEYELAEVVAGVWAPMRRTSATYPSVLVEGAPPKLGEGAATLDREQARFNIDIPDDQFAMTVPEGTRVSDMVAGKVYVFGQADGVGDRLSESVLRGLRPAADLKQYKLGPAQFWGRQPPELTIAAARGVSDTVKLSDYRGKWVLLDFWGPDCGTCISTNLPALAKFYEKHAQQRDRFEVLSICNLGDAPATFAEYERVMAPVIAKSWKGQALPFPVLLDNDRKTFEAYCVHVMPTTLLIGPDGKVVENSGLLTLIKVLDEAGK